MERDKLLGTMDAKVWTDEFMATKAKLGDEEFDHAMMLAWFANVIMAGFDEANRRAQRALDAERERLKVQIDYSIQLQRLIESLKRDDTPAPELYHHTIIVEFKRQLATLQAQLADRDAMILQMGEQAAVLAKENMAVKAQLRQVEGERNTARHRVDELEAREIDVEILQGDLTALRQLVEALPVLDMRFDSVAVGPLGWTVGGVTFGKVTEANAYSALLQYRATQAAQDAGKEPSHD